MPPPIPVHLLPHDPAWKAKADAEASRLGMALGSVLSCVHHIGSTAIEGIRAKPILDLLPVVRSLSQLDDSRERLEALGYEWWGEYGLPDRRYCTLEDRITSQRIVQLHCYEESSSEIARHLAFRDYLRANCSVAQKYEHEKARCRDVYPEDSHAYTDCKNEWIRRVEREALALFGKR